MHNNDTRLEALKAAGATVMDRAGKDPLIGIRPFVAPKDELLSMSDGVFDSFLKLIVERYTELTKGVSSALKEMQDVTEEVRTAAEKMMNQPFLDPIRKQGLGKVVGHLNDAASVLDGMQKKDL